MCGLQVDNLVTFVGQHEGLMISFGGDIDRLKARMDSMERRTTTLQGTYEHLTLVRCSFIISFGIYLIEDAIDM